MKNILQKTLVTTLLVIPLTSFASGGFWGSKPDVAPVNNKLYQEECSDCHFAYQPGLLPARSWEKLMTAKALESHFGDNAELENETRVALLNYLQKNAADTSNHKRSKKIMASLRGNSTPLRIIDTPYIKRKHDEIPSRMIAGNPKVKTLSACEKCHTDASKGMYDDDSVSIPGHGRWEDD